MEHKQIDYGQAAAGAVEAARKLSDLVGSFNPRHYNPKLFQVRVRVGWIKENYRVYKFLYENRIIMDKMDDDALPAVFMSVYFDEKEQAKIFRDIVNQELFAKTWKDKHRNPADYRALVVVQRGPDHKATTGRIA